MSSVIHEVRERVHARGYAQVEDVDQVERVAKDGETAELQILIGHLIQLLEEPGRFRLADAETAYLRAFAIAPNDPEVLVSLGHFYDAVMDDPSRAKPFFESAAALGCSEAQDALEAVLEQLRAG
jgi:hypothetical protein